jgi:hypothetical protein
MDFSFNLLQYLLSKHTPLRPHLKNSRDLLSNRLISAFAYHDLGATNKLTVDQNKRKQSRRQ